MSPSLFERGRLDTALASLRSDLIREEGPQISTMRNHQLAILPYEPKEEFRMRRMVLGLTEDLTAHGWSVVSISLHQLLIDRIHAQGDRWIQRVGQMEQRLNAIDGTRGLNYLKQRLIPLIEGPDGLAADCSRIIAAHREAHPERAHRTVAFITRVAALYPLFRSSALLRHLDGHTGKVPVVLFYPGQAVGPTSLSFMGLLAADSDYRPRIYA